MIIFEVINFQNDEEISSHYSYDMEDDCSIKNAHLSSVHTDLIAKKPSGNYTVVKSYNKFMTLEIAMLANKANKNEEALTSLREILRKRDFWEIKYYQNIADRNTDSLLQNSLSNTIHNKPLFTNSSAKLFPMNIYISHILNDGLYLSKEEFEIKYSSIAKKVKNITKEFGNPSTKYILKGGFFSDHEIVLYEIGSIQADIAISHLCRDHIHWKRITEYLSSVPHFQLIDESYLEKNYLITRSDNFFLPAEIEFVRVLCSIQGNVGIISLNINY